MNESRKREVCVLCGLPFSYYGESTRQYCTKECARIYQVCKAIDRLGDDIVSIRRDG